MKYLVTLSVVFFYVQIVNAQATKRRPVDFDNGDLVVSSTGRLQDGELSKSTNPYSEFITGVFNENTVSSNIPSIIQNGIAFIKFDTDNGHVKKGDYITSSVKTGRAMKSLKSGVMVGVAMENSRNLNGLLKIRVQVGWVKL